MASTWEREGEQWKEQADGAGQAKLVFPTVLVSELVHELIKDIELAAMGCGSCPDDQLNTAYANLNQCRKELYKYISGLERRTKTKRTIVKRF